MTPRTWIIETPAQLANLAAYLPRIVLDRPKQVVLSDYVPPRSTEQNERLWALHRAAAEVTGHSADEMHEFALMRYFGHKDIQIGDMSRQVPLKRSSARNRKEFAEFMEATGIWYETNFGVWLK